VPLSSLADGKLSRNHPNPYAVCSPDASVAGLVAAAKLAALSTALCVEAALQCASASADA
jgi:hypothetical protein